MGLLDQLTPRKQDRAGTEFVYGPNNSIVAPSDVGNKTVGEVLAQIEETLKLPKDVELTIYADGVPVTRADKIDSTTERVEVKKQVGQKG